MNRPGRSAVLAAAAGAAMIFGGEALCIFGPLRYEAVIHRVCHAILYAGIGLVAVAAVVRRRAGRK